MSEARSHNYFVQLKGSALYKVGGIVASFLAIPIMIKYLGVEQFGIWSTMLTLVTWLMMFDLGIGNGLKNKVAESLAQDDLDQAARYISTAYGLVGLMSFGLFTLFLFANIWLPWQKILNTHAVTELVLKEAVITLGFFIFFNFWIGLVNQVYHGLQKSSFVVFGQFISNAFALAFVFLLYKFAKSSVLFMVWAYGTSLVLANFTLMLFVFNTHRELVPSYRNFDKRKIGNLFSLGIKFFIIQLAVLVIFMTDKVLITQLLGPEHVTPFEVLFKLFSVIMVVHGLMLSPLWPAYSDAYRRGDLGWVRTAMRQQIIIAALLFLAALSLAVIGPYVVEVWIGEEVDVSARLFFLFSVFTVFSVWSNVFAYFLNAINVLSLQLVTSVVAAVINIPLSMYFVRVSGLGLDGIILATIISLSIFSLLGPVQVYEILKEKRL